ncbi:ATP-binding SpoIIE family protein phosphatase [Streptomyces griseorubiginosus]|uniref:ATP-binding SpoIIE family protein phosphatase n=1 Tax=Streptomyces griseorubiginosus TaxID=67304 RepID=UPI001AD6D3EE|nr:SpoIIE family protein phosphatase [Streptomyces griseorubiginosus]MBO4252746.1 SpoIIE family protein phosphatase [Streptomyces griseorubiginosus]
MATYVQGSGHSGWSTDVATVTLDRDGTVTGWSEGARRLLGHRAPEVVGRAAAELLLGRQAPGASGLALLGSEEWSGTAALRHRDGHRVDVTLHAHPSLDRDGRPQGFVVTVATSSAASDRDRRMVEWAFDQASVGLSAHSTASGSWHLNAAAAEEDAAGAEAGDGEEGFLRCVRRVAEEGRSTRYERLVPEPASAPVRHRAWVIELWPVRDPATGEVVGVGTAAFDSSEQHAARERLALLQEAGVCVGTTLNVTRTAQELADLAVPRLADFVSVDLLDSVLRGEEPVPGPVDAAVALRRAAHQSAAEGTGVPEAAIDLGGIDTYPPFSPPARALAGGRPVLTGAGDPDFARWLAGHEARTARNEEYGFHSVMATPLRARGITLGVAVFARIGDSPPFEPDDLILAEELAGRTAVGVDNARRYTRERTNALTLQRSLLPRDLPRQAAVEVAYRYLPAGSGAGVGGDWFDVVPLSGTRVGLVVGDVVGHGIHASATMGRLRTAVRTLADVDLPPDELLTHLDDLVAHLSSDREDVAVDEPYFVSGEIGATCLYAVYDPVSRVCTFASAGHIPPAVLLPDGTVELVRLTPGPLLGVGGLPFETTELELPEGSLLAFCTDGLIEARDRDVGLGLDRLCDALSRPVPSLDVTCDAILKALLPDSPADDVALLLVRTRALHADQVAAWSLPSDPSVVADARAQVSRQLAVWGLEEAAFVTELVVSELVTNAIRYGAVPIGLRLIRDRTLICEVSDASNTAPHLRRARTYDEGGRGLHMVAQLTQGWGTRQSPLGKTIWAEQPLPAG